MTNMENIEQLFREHYNDMFFLSFSLLKDEDSARDVVHDVFTALLTSPPEERGKGYLLRCVRNRCINLLKKMPVKESVERLISLTELQQDDEATEREEYLERIRHMIAGELPPQCAKVMIMRFEKGLSYLEIAEELGISKVAVYKHLKNGLDHIREKITCKK